MISDHLPINSTTMHSRLVCQERNVCLGNQHICPVLQKRCFFWTNYVILNLQDLKCPKAVSFMPSCVISNHLCLPELWIKAGEKRCCVVLCSDLMNELQLCFYSSPWLCPGLLKGQHTKQAISLFFFSQSIKKAFDIFPSYRDWI